MVFAAFPMMLFVGSVVMERVVVVVVVIVVENL